MANRRMFSLDVVDTDKFLEMPTSTQALYFQLGMRADDDGFVSSPKRITSLVGASPDDLKLLVAKGFIIAFQNGVIVICHWRQNNYVRCDRYTKSIHVDEMNSLSLENGIYCIGIPDDIPNDIPTVSTDKNRIDKSRLDKSRADNIICSEPDKSAPNPSGILIVLNDKSYYDVPLEKITMWKATYPAVDVEQELRKMGAWCDSNPTRRKTKRGIERFINNWLSRTQDSGWSKGQKGVKETSGNSIYDTDAGWEHLVRTVTETKCNSTGGEDLPFK